MEIRDYIRVLRKNWATIVALTTLGLVASVAVSLFMTPKYESSSELYVSVRSSDSATGDLVQGSTFAQQAVSSYVEVATNAIVLEQVIEELSLEESVQELAAKMTVTSQANTVLMSVTVTDTDPQNAADIVNTTSTVLADVVENDLEVSTVDGSGPVQVETVQPGVVPEEPVSPRFAMNIAIGILAGLVIGLLVAVLRSVLDTRIRSLHDLENSTETPVLGGIAHDRKIDTRPLIVHSDRKNPLAESFRSLRTNLQFVGTESDSRTFVISSSLPNEGKTTTAANLAVVLAETGAKVVLVDGDLRKPRVAEIMGIEGGVGLTDVLIGRAEMADVLQPWGTKKLTVLPAGRVPPNPSELLGSATMERVLRNLGESADYVLIDSAPVLPVTDAAVVSQFSTGTILVVSAGSTKRDQLESAVDTLEHGGVRVLGMVGTKLPTKGADAYTRGTYTYGYETEEAAPIDESGQVNFRRARKTGRSR